MGPIVIPTRTLYISNEQTLTHWDQSQLQLIYGNQRYQAQLASHELKKISSEPLSTQPVRELHPFSPDGKQLVTITSTQEDLRQANAASNPQLQQRVLVSDANGQNVRELDKVKGRIQQAAWGPSGQTLAYVSEPMTSVDGYLSLQPGQISQLHLHSLSQPEWNKVIPVPLPQGAPTGSKLQILSLAWYPVQGAATPSQDRELLLLVEASHPSPYYAQKQLLKLNLSTGSFSPILIQKNPQDLFAGASAICLSPDGKDIYYLAGGLSYGNTDAPNLYKAMNPDPQAAVNIVEQIQANSLPVWSPDGSQMAAIKIGPNLQQELQLCNSLGRECRSLTQTPDLQESRPIWSPDSKQLAYAVLESLDQKDALGFYTLSVESSVTSTATPRRFTGLDNLNIQSSLVAMKTYYDASNSLQNNPTPFKRPDSLKD